MASKRHSRRRTIPYDLGNPTNWTAAQLRKEISKLGVNLTTSIPKTALIQIYTQLYTASSSTVSQGQSNVSEKTNENDGNLLDRFQSENVQMDKSQDSGISSHITTSTTDNVISLPDRAVPHDSQTVLLQSTVGMVSAMQSAIASLQSTVTSLLQKQTASTSSSNHLEQFYQQTPAQPSSLSQQTSANLHGVAADSLPHIDVVSETMRKNIVSGKYVNLACLLIPDYDVSKSPVDNMPGTELFKRQQRDHRLDRVLSITQFFKAFGIYKRVMCEAFPQRRDELNLYEADIANIYEHYGDLFYQYHVQFSRQAAAYMEKGIKIDWSKRHKDLFQLLVGGAKTKLCDHCSQADHQSPFCPTQISVPRPSKSKAIPIQDSSKDTFGRPRVFFKGREICNNFNGEKGCSRSVCPFEHICKKCKSSGHGQNSCNPQIPAVPDHSHKAETNKSKTSV